VEKSKHESLRLQDNGDI